MEHVSQTKLDRFSVLIAYILVWVGNQPLTVAVLFLFYYTLLFDDSPRAECQQAGIGTGLATGGIYCHDAGDRLLVHYSSIFESHQQPSVGVERVPKYL